MKIPDSFSQESKPDGSTVILKNKYKDMLQKEVIPYIKDPDGKAEKINKGRGVIFRFSLADNELKNVIVRQNKRGGLFGKIIGSAGCSKSRAFNEVVNNNAAFEKGLAVPEMLGLYINPKSIGNYGVFIITKEIVGTKDLPDYLEGFDRTDYAKKGKLLESLLDTIKGFHDEGFYHPDLNMTNLLAREDDGKINTWIVDFDKVTHKDSLSYKQRRSNLIRLTRSLVKLRLDKFISASDRLRFINMYLKAINKGEKRGARKLSYACTGSIRRHFLIKILLGKMKY